MSRTALLQRDGWIFRPATPPRVEEALRHLLPPAPPETDGVAAVAEAIGVVGEVDRALAADAVPTEDLRTVLEGLGQLEAVLTAARTRALCAADVAGLPGDDAAVSLAAWLAQVQRMTGTGAAREARFAVTLSTQDDLLAQLSSGAISRDHAMAMVAELQRQRADQDARAAAERARQERERRARAAADLEAQRQARTHAERRRMAQEAARREAELAEQERRAREAQREADRRAQQARQEDLLAAASEGASADEVRRRGRDMRANDNADLERDAVTQHRRRAVREWVKDGMHHLLLILGDEAYERYRAAEAAAMTFDKPEVPEDERRTYEQRRADAAVDIIDAALAAGDLPTRRGVKPHLSAVAPVDTLLGEDIPGRGEFGSWFSAETVRRLSCDAGLTRALVDATGQVIDMGRETNRWSVAAYKAMQIMFDGCVFPTGDGTTCGRPLDWCDLHHVEWYRHGGRTDLINALPGCRHHHIMIHHDGWAMTYDPVTGVVTITRERDGLTRSARVRRDLGEVMGGQGQLDLGRQPS